MQDGRIARHAHRRPELTEAAARYVFEHGVNDLALRPMATALGVTHATLIHHFGSKEALLVAALERLRTEERMAVVGLRAEGEPADVRRLLCASWERLSSEQHLPFLTLLFEMVGGALRRPDRYGDFAESLVEEWTATIRALLEQEGCSADRARSLSTFVYDSFRGLLLDWVSTRERERVDAGFAELAAALEALLPAAAGERA